MSGQAAARYNGLQLIVYPAVVPSGTIEHFDRSSIWRTVSPSGQTVQPPVPVTRSNTRSRHASSTMRLKSAAAGPAWSTTQ